MVTGVSARDPLFVNLYPLLEWVEDRRPVGRIEELTPADVSAFAGYAMEIVGSTPARARIPGMVGWQHGSNVRLAVRTVLNELARMLDMSPEDLNSSLAVARSSKARHRCRSVHGARMT